MVSGSISGGVTGGGIVTQCCCLRSVVRTVYAVCARVAERLLYAAGFSGKHLCWQALQSAAVLPRLLAGAGDPRRDPTLRRVLVP